MVLQRAIKTIRQVKFWNSSQLQAKKERLVIVQRLNQGIHK